MRARPTPRPRATIIEALREDIRRIEGRTSARGYGASSMMMDSSDAHSDTVRARVSLSPVAADAAGWTLGDGKAHAAWDLPALDVAGVHEIKPAVAGMPNNPMSDDCVSGGSWAANTSAALGFILALITRRLVRIATPVWRTGLAQSSWAGGLWHRSQASAFGFGAAGGRRAGRG